MKANIQNQIQPPTAQAATLMNAAKVKKESEVVDSVKTPKLDFDRLVANSNEAIERDRSAKMNGDLTADNKEEFFKKLSDQTNKDIRVPKNKLAKDDFLKLFVEQMKNQDPLNPDDGAELAAKMAQFNSVEQMMNMNKSLETLANDKNKDRSLMLTNFIGKEMAVDGGRIKLEVGKSSESKFELPMGAARSTLEIRDESGQLVFDRSLGSLSKGSHKLSWDGRNKNGIELPKGVYSYSVVAKDMNEQDVPVRISSQVKVLGVDVMDKKGKLFTDFGSVNFDDIISVGDAKYDAKSESKLKVHEIDVKSAANKAENTEGVVDKQFDNVAASEAASKEASTASDKDEKATASENKEESAETVKVANADKAGATAVDAAEKTKNQKDLAEKKPSAPKVTTNVEVNADRSKSRQPESA